MIIAAGVVRVIWMKRLLNIFMREGSIPEEWWIGLIAPKWKGKGDVQDPVKYRGWKQKSGWWKGCTRECREEFWLVLGCLRSSA